MSRSFQLFALSSLIIQLKRCKETWNLNYGIEHEPVIFSTERSDAARKFHDDNDDRNEKMDVVSRPIDADANFRNCVIYVWCWDGFFQQWDGLFLHCFILASGRIDAAQIENSSHYTPTEWKSWTISFVNSMQTWKCWRQNSQTRTKAPEYLIYSLNCWTIDRCFWGISPLIILTKANIFAKQRKAFIWCARPIPFLTYKAITLNVIWTRQGSPAAPFQFSEIALYDSFHIDEIIHVSARKSQQRMKTTWHVVRLLVWKTA